MLEHGAGRLGPLLLSGDGTAGGLDTSLTVVAWDGRTTKLLSLWFSFVGVAAWLRVAGRVLAGSLGLANDSGLDATFLLLGVGSWLDGTISMPSEESSCVA